MAVGLAVAPADADPLEPGAQAAAIIDTLPAPNRARTSRRDNQRPTGRSSSSMSMAAKGSIGGVGGGVISGGGSWAVVP